MARVYGLEVVRMADADVLPYDYEEYGREISVYIDAAKKKAEARFGDRAPSFKDAAEAAKRLEEAGNKVLDKQRKLPSSPARLNQSLREAERQLLIPEGLPKRPWYHHAIYAPGEYTGYAAVVIPGVNEAITKGDLELTTQQIAALTAALNRAAKALAAAR
jgi:N-acetylated-alpha-linked acidic dipeptidase